jgi:hypothetical protein
MPQIQTNGQAIPRHHTAERRNAVRGRNHRPLDDISADIHKLERESVFAKGDLLIEAKDQLDHGEFLSWVNSEFEWSKSTAENYMNAARLKAKFPNIGNLKLAKTTIYELAELMAADNDELMESIIAALTEQATHNQLKATAATDIMLSAGLRWEFGDYPEATLYALHAVKITDGNVETMEALKAEQPTTEEAARAIVEQMREHHEETDTEETDTEETDTEETDTEETATEETDETDTEQQTEEEEETQEQQTEDQVDEVDPLVGKIQSLLNSALTAEIKQFNRDNRSWELRDKVRDALGVLSNTARDPATNINRRTERMLDRGL